MSDKERMSDQELLALVEAKNDHIEVLEQRIRDIKLALNESYEKGCHESGSQEAQQAVPEGWKLVPIEPSDDMFNAFSDQFEEGVIYTLGFLLAYHDMLAAAPAAPNAKCNNPCAHHFEHFGDQPLRRCIHCRQQEQQTAPQAEQQAESPKEPLTDEQIEQMEADALTKIPEKYWAPLHEFARAIERTLAARWGVKLKGDS